MKQDILFIKYFINKIIAYRILKKIAYNKLHFIFFRIKTV